MYFASVANFVFIFV